MNITGLSYKFIMFNLVSDHIFEAEIPFTGEESVLTKITREPYESKVEKYKLSKDAIAQYLALIGKYNITEWTGKTPSNPQVYKNEGLHQASFLTLNFDDGSTAEITFRENEEAGKEASEEFRKIFVSLTNKDNLISKETVYPNLKECRGMKEIHGPVTAVKTSHYTSGMMYNSNQTVYQTIERSGEGRVRVTVRKKAGNEPEVSGSAETESDILSRVQEISDRENLPCWEYAAIDPSIPVDRSMQPLDYSSSSSLSVYYDDTLITGMPRVKRTIGESACKLGGAEVDREISDMIYEVVTKSGVKVDMPYINYFANAQPLATQTPPMMQFMGMGMALAAAGTASSEPAPDTSRVSSPAAFNSDGTWNCPSCGETGLTGKFCPGCGRPGPQTETQNRTLGV